jgi:FkbM family methyltransferase
MKGTNPSLILRTLQTFGVSAGLKTIYQLNTGNYNRITLPAVQHPLFLRPNTSDINLFYAIFLRGEYDFNLPAPPKRIIDAGANVGLFAIKIKNRFPEAEIICIEPDPENFELLQRNVAPYKGIVCENKGIWSRNTRLRVVDKYGVGKWALSVEEDSAGPIESITIPSLLDKHDWGKADLLKMDIEGSEKQLFNHPGLDWLLKVKTIVIELHDRFEPGCAQPFFKAINEYYGEYSYDIRAENTIVTNGTDL